MTTPHPEGWYPAADRPGFERRWDGQRWTDQIRYAGAERPPEPASARSSKRTLIIAGSLVAALLVAGGAAFAVKQSTRSSVCKEYCSEAASLNEQKCTSPDVQTCDSLMGEKVRIALTARDMAVSESEMSREVERLHSSAGRVESVGSRWTSNDCSQPQQGDKLFRCRTIASDLDEKFSRFTEQLQALP